MAAPATDEAASEATAGVNEDVVAMVARAQDGDTAAFAEIYDRYVDQVYGFVYRRTGHRQTAEDLTADVFTRAYRRLGSFEWQGVDIGAWFMTIARNRVYDHYKSASTRFETAVDIAPDGPLTSAPDDPERVASSRDLAKGLGRALENLKDSHREVIELRFVHNLSVAETAEVMDRTVGACKALQYRALRALAAEVEDQPGLAEIAAAGLGGLIALLGMLR